MIDNGDVQECFQLALKYFQSREAIYFSFGLRLQVKERRHAAATREQATSAISIGKPPLFCLPLLTAALRYSFSYFIPSIQEG